MHTEFWIWTLVRYVGGILARAIGLVVYDLPQPLGYEIEHLWDLRIHALRNHFEVWW